jgi:hypothetical protein
MRSYCAAGSGVHGWETVEEEDVWDLDLDFTGNESEEEANPGSTVPEMTIAEIMEVRYLRAEKEKELVRLFPALGSLLEWAVRLLVRGGERCVPSRRLRARSATLPSGSCRRT